MLLLRFPVVCGLLLLVPVVATVFVTVFAAAFVAAAAAGAFRSPNVEKPIFARL